MKSLQSAEAGFSLVEMLVATALFLLVLSALATITAQWLPNWNRGFVQVQSTEKLALGLERIAEDLAAAEFVPSNGKTTAPLFYGTELSVTFVRTAIGPNSAPGLQIVRLAEIADNSGLLLVRAAIPFVPFDPDALTMQFPNPVVLIHPPFRVEFSYTGLERSWRNSWHDGNLLPSAVRIMVRNMVTGKALAFSTAITIHNNAPAVCATGITGCGGLGAPAAAAVAKAN